MLRDGLAAALRVARGQLAPAPAPVPIPDDSGRECYRVSFSALKPLADVADLPRTETGKVQRFKLREQELQGRG